jgi:6-phosphogluconolactonase
MSFKTEVFDDHPRGAADRIAELLPVTGSIVLTGGTTAERIYPHLALREKDWTRLSVLFSDERRVPPDDPASNFKMANDLLLKQVGPEVVHRMRGEDDPALAAKAYDEEIRDIVDAGLNLLLLGMGADCHIGAMFPGSPALQEHTALCAPVERPDGMNGLTLTPPVILAAKKVLLLVAGAGKAEAVRRVINGTEDPSTCPARLLADHNDATFLLDEDAAKLL